MRIDRQADRCVDTREQVCVNSFFLERLEQYLHFSRTSENSKIFYFFIHEAADRDLVRRVSDRHYNDVNVRAFGYEIADVFVTLDDSYLVCEEVLFDRIEIRTIVENGDPEIELGHQFGKSKRAVA